MGAPKEKYRGFERYRGLAAETCPLVQDVPVRRQGDTAAACQALPEDKDEEGQGREGSALHPRVQPLLQLRLPHIGGRLPSVCEIHHKRCHAQEQVQCNGLEIGLQSLEELRKEMLDAL